MYYAKLYTLSGRYQIRGLKLLASRHIHTILSRFPIVWRRIPDLIPLIRYVYADTAAGDLLRHMVILFTVALKERLMLHPEFSKLLSEQHVFCHDVLQHVWRLHVLRSNRILATRSPKRTVLQRTTKWMTLIRKALWLGWDEENALSGNERCEFD